MHLAVVLGAGFSKAVHPAFPTVDELGELVRARVPKALSSAPRVFSGGAFERWLSRIAEPQPDLGVAENLGNARDFQIVTEVIHEQMVSIEAQAIREPIPWWLLRFIGVLHATRATVVTFNYDTLIEGAAARTFDHRLSQGLNAYSITDGIPPTPPMAGMIGPTITPSFRVLKLHGSVDTYWVPGDATGATITRVTDPVWAPNGGMSSQTLNIARQAPGRVPFVVPPASAKSAFFANPITRQLWRTAAQRLAACDQIAVIGYSVPLTDIVATAMLVDAQRASGARVDIVNPNPRPVIQRLVDDAGIPAEAVRETATTCEVYVDQLERQVSALACRSMWSELRSSLPLAVAGFGTIRPVTGMQVAGAEVHLRLAGPQTREEGIDTSHWLRSDILLATIADSHADAVAVEVDSEVARVIDHYLWPYPEHGHALAMLVPSATRLPGE